jgi:chromosome segregation ATPase
MASNNQATQICNQIHNLVQNSGLHFMINQTPHSSYIPIRRRFIRSENYQHNLSEACMEEDNLKEEIRCLKSELEKVSNEKNILEAEGIEKDLALEIIKTQSEENLEKVHLFCDRVSSENDKLKDTVATLHNEISQIQADLTVSRKSVKAKEKEIHNLTTKFDNS